MHIISILERTLKNGFDNPKAPIEKGFKEGYENALIILQRNDLETAQRKINALIKTLEDDARHDFGKGRMLALFETSLMIGAVLKGDDADDIEGGYVATTGEKHYCEDDSEIYFDYSPTITRALA